MSADDFIKILGMLLSSFGPGGAVVLVYAGWVTWQKEKQTGQMLGNLPAEVAAKVSLDQTMTRVVAVLERVTQQLDRKV